MGIESYQLGQKGEEAAEKYLQQQGYQVIERNYRSVFGEIDIIAEEGETLVFVEVKCRRSDAYGPPELAVGREKQKKISRIALHYLSEHHLRQCPARFDVVAVKLLPGGTQIELIRNAFELSCV